MAKKNLSTKPKTTVYDHVCELRRRFLFCLFTLVVVSVLVYSFYDQILRFLCSPLGETLYYNNPAGSFSFILKICLAGAMIVTIPVMTYNIIMFLQPAFQKYLPRKRIIKTTLGSTVLAISGAIFAFYCILPGTLSFLKGFEVEGLKSLISADNYLNFVTNIIIMFVIVFQIPLILLFIDTIKPIPPKKLFSYEKWIVLGSLIMALLAPFTYDLLTSLLIAVPVVVLYNISIALILTRQSKRRRQSHKEFCQNIYKKALVTNKSNSSEPSFNDLAHEIINYQRTKVSACAINQKSTADIVSPIAQSKQEIQPAEWVLERKRRREELNQKVGVFSDIKQKPKSNHALASR